MLQLTPMKRLVFSTGNAEKFSTAKQVCSQYGIELTQKKLNITEIQEEDPKKVAEDKAAKAFVAAKQSIVISDDSWSFLGLRGFPGIYMHSMNEWFKPEDFLRLTLTVEDRRVVLTQYLVYADGNRQKIFRQQTKGLLLKEIRGVSEHPSHTLITMIGSKGLSIAETYEQSIDRSMQKTANVWHDFAKWFNES